MKGSSRHFEEEVQDLLEEHGPLTTSQLNRKLAEERILFNVMASREVYEGDIMGVGKMTIIDPQIRKVSSHALSERLSKSWGVSQNAAGKWYLEEDE